MSSNYPNAPPNVVDSIIDFEAGDLSEEETVALFQRLIDSGLAWKLQGYYGRMAQSLIDNGLCHAGPHGG